MNLLIYDIESVQIENHYAFTIVFKMNENMAIYYLIDDTKSFLDLTPYKAYIENVIREKNKRLTNETFKWFNLSEPKNIDNLAKIIGVSNKNATKENDFAKFNLAYNIPTNIIGIESYNVDTILTNKKSYYLCDFNGISYDTTIISLFFELTLNVSGSKDINGYNTVTISPVSAKQIFEHNNNIFKYYKQNMPAYLYNHTLANDIRKNILYSGKHIDVPKLSGTQIFKSLKEQAGNLGTAIIENENVSGIKLDNNSNFLDKIANLLAYNTSDVVLTDELLKHPFYKGNIDVGKVLINEYPQMTYDYMLNEKLEKIVDVNKPRMKLPSLDDTSANKVATILAPYDKMADWKYISLNYPNEDKAREYNMQVYNVLELAKQIFYTNITDKKARAEFDKAYNLYKDLEGKNVNMSTHYKNLYGEIPVEELKDKKINIPLFNRNGEALPIVVTISIGGIHGCRIATKDNDILNAVKQNKTLKYTVIGNYIHCDFSSFYPIMLIMLGSFKTTSGDDPYSEIYDKKELYAKEALKYNKLKDKENEELFKTKRAGTKQNLNATTGKACPKKDEPYNKIQMNNKITSMRMIGQLFTYIMVQLQVFYGGFPDSINTDGVYVTNINKSDNDKILKYIYDITRVKIEPEEMILVSKDSNSRAEFDTNLNYINSSSSIGAYNGPIINKSATKPAIVDNIICDYFKLLKQNNKTLHEPIYENEIKNMLINKTFDSLGKKLLMFSLIIKASNSSFRFPCLVTNGTDLEPLNHYSRIFIVKKEFSNKNIINLELKTISKTTLKKRRNNDEKLIQHDYTVLPIMEQILKHLKLELPDNRECVTSKITNIDPKWYIKIVNEDLYYMNEKDQIKLLNELDYDAYIELIKSEYANWQNT